MYSIYINSKHTEIECSKLSTPIFPRLVAKARDLITKCTKQISVREREEVGALTVHVPAGRVML